MSVPAFAPASPVPYPAYIVDHWYPTNAVAAANGVAAATGLVRMYPFFLPARITVSALMARVNTIGAGSFQLAIYANSATTGLPTGAVLARTGDMSSLVGAAIVASITGGNVILNAGVYWAAINVDAASAVAVFQTLGNNSTGTTSIVGVISPDIAASATGSSVVTLTTPMAYNTWSSMTSATFTEVGGPNSAAHVWLKAA